MIKNILKILFYHFQSNDKCGKKASLKKPFFTRPTNQPPFSRD